MTSLATALGAEQFVSMTTFRRSGEGVATPLWVARDGDELVITTFASSGKVKRLRHDPRVQLQACDRRGRVAPGAPTWTGQARVLDDDASRARTTALLTAKYRWQFRGVNALEVVVRRRLGTRVTVRVGPAPPG